MFNDKFAVDMLRERLFDLSSLILHAQEFPQHRIFFSAICLSLQYRLDSLEPAVNAPLVSGIIVSDGKVEFLHLT